MPLKFPKRKDLFIPQRRKSNKNKEQLLKTVATELYEHSLHFPEFLLLL